MLYISCFNYALRHTRPHACPECYISLVLTWLSYALSLVIEQVTAIIANVKLIVARHCNRPDCLSSRYSSRGRAATQLQPPAAPGTVPTQRAAQPLRLITASRCLPLRPLLPNLLLLVVFPDHGLERPKSRSFRGSSNYSSPRRRPATHAPRNLIATLAARRMIPAPATVRTRLTTTTQGRTPAPHMKVACSRQIVHVADVAAAAAAVQLVPVAAVASTSINTARMLLPSSAKLLAALGFHACHGRTPPKTMTRGAPHIAVLSWGFGRGSREAFLCAYASAC